MTWIPTRQTDLKYFLRLYWFAPPVALWRAVEARTVARQRYATPMLDFGCGHGRFAAAVFGAGRSITAGCDLLAFQLADAHRVGAYQSVQLADGHHLPYPDGSFATVFSNSVLEHIPNPLPVLCELGRVLGSQGRLIVTVPSDRFHDYLGGNGASEGYRAEIDRRLHHFHYHTPLQWAASMDQAGLQLVEHQYYMSPEATAVWDRLNRQFGVGRRSWFSILASPRFRALGYQVLLARWLPRWLDGRLRPCYAQDLPAGMPGGGLLLIAKRG